MALFEKREYIFEKKDRAAWQAAKSALKAAGVTGVRASSIEGEMPICGCGAKLDIRDFGPNGKIDRNLYYIQVPVSQVEKAREVLKNL